MEFCALCGKKLRPFKTTNDWTSRKYHKVCFRKMNEEAYYNSFFSSQEKKGDKKREL